jgi:hypothetical protein
MACRDSELLEQLQLWYASQCNGQWEHSNGISIQTIDNPGWSLRVDLANTGLTGQSFDEIRVDGADSRDWYVCRVTDDVFEAFSGPGRLTEIIHVFLLWAGQAVSAAR